MLFHFAGKKEGMLSFIRMYRNGMSRAEIILTIVMISVAFIATALNSLASTAFTREGQHLSLIKFIPVPYSTQMYAKAFVSFMFTFPALVLTDIIVCCYMKTPVYIAVLYGIFMLLAHIIAVAVGMMMDSSAPYVVWDDEYSALRGNLNTFFNMAVMMLLSVGVIVLGVIMYELLKLPVIAFYIVLFLILAATGVRMLLIAPKKIVENMAKMS